MDQSGVAVTHEVPSHVPFSPRRIAVIAANTLTELTRQKVFYVLLLFALVLIGSSVFMARMTFQQKFQVLQDISLGAISLFTSLLAIVATARMLPQGVEERTVYTILARAVSRFEYLAGKLLGVLLLLAISTLIMSALFFAVLYLQEQAALGEPARHTLGLPPEHAAEALGTARAAIHYGNLALGIGTIFLKSCLLASLTLFISTFATTNLFTIVVSVVVYFIGHLQGVAREFWLAEQGGGWPSRVFLGSVALLFPDLQLFNVADQIVAGVQIPPTFFIKCGALGCLYTLVYLMLAAAVFSGKEL